LTESFGITVDQFDRTPMWALRAYINRLEELADQQSR
jgi:hypothetical protein